MAEVIIRVGQSLIRVDMFGLIEHDTWRTRVDQPCDAVSATAFDHVQRSDGVDSVIRVPWTPDTGNSRNMKHHVNVGTRPPNGVRISDVTVQAVDAKFSKTTVSPTTEHADLVTAFDELFDDVEAQESTAK